MTRREFVYAGTLAMGAICLSGCGGFFGSGGGGGTSTLVRILGNVTMPSGVAEGDCAVVAGTSTNAPSGGQFRVSVPGGNVTIVVLVHKTSEKAILLGVLDPEESAHHLDATSTAEALLFVALGGNQMPLDGRLPLLSLIRTAPQTATLASVIQSELNADGFALDGDNPAIQNAVAAAAQAISVALSTRPAHREASREQIPRQLLIEPSNEVDGVTVLQSTDLFGYKVQNERRRVAQMFTYLVGHVDANGVRTDIPAQLVGEPLEIPATRTLFNLASGWQPRTSVSRALALQTGDSKSIYELVYLCPVYTTPQPTFLTLPRYEAEAARLTAASDALLRAQSMHIVGDILLDILGISGLTFGIAELSATITSLTAVNTNFVALLEGAQQGYALIPIVVNTLNAFLGEGLAGTPRIISALTPLIEKAGTQQAAELAAGQASAEVYIAFRAVLRIALTVGLIALVGELGAVAKDTQTGQRGSLFSATVFQPSVSISPANRVYTAGDSFGITAVAPGTAGLTLRYRWKLEGSSLANLSDGTNVGIEFDSNSPDVTLATTLSTVGTLTVTVTVTNITNGANEPFGSAVGTYALSEDYYYQSWIIPPGGGYPQGGGTVVACVSVPLDPDRTQVVRCTNVIENEGTLYFTTVLPRASTPIPLNTPTTSAMTTNINPNAVSVTDVINQQFINSHMPFCPNLANYGDRMLFRVLIGGWDNRPYPGNNLQTEAQALAALRANVASRRCTVVPV